MKPVGANLNLCTKAKLVTISEARKPIPINCRRINLAKKSLCPARVACHDAITMMRTKSFDVFDRVHTAVDYPTAETGSRNSVDQSARSLVDHIALPPFSIPR